jgi:hypothetical protein
MADHIEAARYMYEMVCEGCDQASWGKLEKLDVAVE